MTDFLTEYGIKNTRGGIKFYRIFHAVFQHPGISRSELGELLELNKNNITGTIGQMLDDGVLTETEQPVRKKTGAGRRRIGLSIRPDLFYTLGASFTLESPSLVLVGADRQVVKRCLLRNNSNNQQERFLSEIRQKSLTLIRSVGAEKVIGAGISLPGIVDIRTGQVISSQPFKGGPEFSLRDFFRRELNLEIVLINESHVRPVMEKLYGDARQMEHFIVIDEGLGAGMFFNGRLYRGWQGYGGEFGYMKISDDPTIGPDGRTGLLHDKAIFRLIGEKIHRAMKNGGKVSIKRDWEEDGYIHPLILLDAIKEGDFFVAQLLGEVFSHIGDALVSVAYLLNPEAIFLPWWTARCPQYTVDMVKMKMGSYGLGSWPLKTQILSSKSTPEYHAEVAAYLFADQYFKQKLKKKTIYPWRPAYEVEL